MRPTGSASRSNEKIHLSKHDKKIEQRAKDFMDVFKNFDFSPAGHITCMIHLLAPKAVKLGEGPAAQRFNQKFAQFSNELDLALGKSKKEENKNELKAALVRLIAERGLPQKYQMDYQSASSNFSTAEVINWLKLVRKEINPPKMTSRPQSQIITPLQTTTTTSPFPTTTTAPVIRASNSYRSMPTPQQASTGNMMPSYPNQPLVYPNPMPVNQMQQPAPYPATNYVSAPSFPQAPMAMWHQGQVQPYPGTTNWPQQQQQQQQPWQSPNAAPQGQFMPYPGTMNWPQQQQQQQYFYPPQQNGNPWNSGS